MNRTTYNFAPHFMIIGAAKAGTTTLYDDLARHPDVALPSQKEPDILHTGKTLEACAELYARHFEKMAEGYKVRGEGSTYYTMQPKHENVASRAKALCGPDLKLIYIMRDPIARIKSHLAHTYAAGGISDANFDAAVMDNPLYRSLSDYPMQLQSWLSEFDQKQILCIRFESFINHREDTVRAVCAHIGIDPDKINVGKQISNAKGSQKQHRFTFVENFLRSETYRYKLRPLMPRGISEVAKGILMSKRPPKNVQLSTETEQYLCMYFSDQDEKLNALGLNLYPNSEVSV